ncbi:MAG: DUF465 domain-containing protein [Candidatus Endolissoclinum sp.]|jgi:hypothetical protein|nr:DUF465 domain-containing protein [Candidatus Endolissoclinum sp.]|tara:strand:+ start:482 stop:679 length:198 start_codon:yes stop_codon:yes gene_type:complete
MAKNNIEKKRTRLIYLKKQHRDLDEGIITAFKMHTEDNVVSKLKLKKLHIKEQIAHLEDELEVSG